MESGFYILVLLKINLKNSVLNIYLYNLNYKNSLKMFLKINLKK